MKMMNEQDSMEFWCREIYEWCQRKGWNDDLDKRSFGDWMALLHSEISEAYEHHRDGWQPGSTWYDHEKSKNNEQGMAIAKPDGIPIEIADLLIRIFHFCARFGINPGEMIARKMEYNECRAYRHADERAPGGKVT